MPSTENPRSLRVALSTSIEESALRHLPAGVEAVRYAPDHTETMDVDMLVPVVAPGFGVSPATILKYIHPRYIQTSSAGVEAIQPLVPPGVVLCNARGVHDAPTAEWAVTAILASLKWLPFYGDLRRDGHWASSDDTEAYWQQCHGEPRKTGIPVFAEELAEKTVLIVGYGAIGKAIEARLLPFEPGRIVRVARTAREGVEPVSALDTLLPKADIVVLITPLTKETHHLIGAAQLSLMRRGTFLVNAARGGVIDTDALVASLQAHHIRAALDVTDPEPLPDGHPLWSAPGLLLTPHVAGSTPLFLDRVFRFVGRQLQHLLDGEEPENIITGHY